MSIFDRITILSGGQTGADRAALDFAIEQGIAHGGWCPRGRRAEDGPIPSRYQLEETPSCAYAERTEWNVRDADATVIFSIAPQVTGGTSLAATVARRLGKPWLHLSREKSPAPGRELIAFLTAHGVCRLNIAGPRESQEPEIAAYVREVLQTALQFSENAGE